MNAGSGAIRDNTLVAKKSQVDFYAKPTWLLCFFIQKSDRY